MKNLSSQKKRTYNKKDIAVMAVCHLGGGLRHIHMEDVALKAGELSPRDFSWRKYPERINLEAVRVTLKNELASRERRVVGSIHDGWMVTPAGLSWCLSNSKVRGSEDFMEQIQKEIGRVRTTMVFKKVIGGRSESVSDAELRVFLRTDEYSSNRTSRERAIALLNAATLDRDLQTVLDRLTDIGIEGLEVPQ